MNDHWLPAGAGGKLHPFHKQQRFDALLHPHHLVDKGVAQLGEVTKLAIKRARNMDPFELSPTQILGQSDTVEPIGLHSLSWRFGNHRWRGDQAAKVLRYQPIIQSVAVRSLSVQLHRQKPPSDWESAYVRGSPNAPRCTACATI